MLEPVQENKLQSEDVSSTKTLEDDMQKQAKKQILGFSMVIPVFNEEESLRIIVQEIIDALTSIQKTFEIVFVDDCSSDTSPRILKELQNEFPDIVRVITLSQRSGQTHAMQQGIQHSKGEIVVTLDADLQNDPADIPKLYAKMKEGYDCVCGWRKARQDSFLKAKLSKLGNVLQRLFTGTSVHDVSCTLRAYTNECARKIPLNWEGQHRFIALCLLLQGFRVGEIVSNHRERKFGQTKYSHKRIFRVIVDFFRILKTRGRE